MKVLVLGDKGSIGQRRSQILAEMGHNVTGIDQDGRFSPDIAKGFEAIFICTPPIAQMALALSCAEAGVPFFMEKPGATLAYDLRQVAAAADNLVTMVSCNLRFTSEYRAILDALPNIGKPIFSTAEFGYYLPFWRDADYKTYYSCYRSQGGGVLMDAVHELDYMFSLYGGSDKCRSILAKCDRTGELGGVEAEDTATLCLDYPHGPTCVIHIDYLQRSYKRTFTAVGTKGRIDQVFNVQDNNMMYRREMGHFIECIKRGEQTLKPVSEQVKLLDFIEAVRSARPREVES